MDASVARHGVIPRAADDVTATPLPAELARELAREREQCGFEWPGDRWRRWLSDVEGVPDLLESLPNPIDRRDAASVVERELRDGSVARAFVAVMTWGHGRTGYGAYRTAVVLTGCGASRGRRRVRSVAGSEAKRGGVSPMGQPADPESIAKLRHAAEMVRSDRASPVDAAREAHAYLIGEGHIRGLGPAFFTKWLYFASSRSDPYGADCVPVLDALVAQWLGRHSAFAPRYGDTSDYETYVYLLRSWADHVDSTSPRVEEAIFELAVKERTNSKRR